MKKITVGILAHVDAGKTTCIESMLYDSGVIRKPGRVDHRDTVLDYDEEERGHGITIYAKEAHFNWKNTEVFVIDTPGHVDFSAEMERSLQILDLAIILINGQDGVQSHTETIWKCLEHNHIPAIIFVNKMDISHYSEEELLKDLQNHCSDMCMAWNSADRMDSLAMVSDEMLEEYTETGKITDDKVVNALYERKFFPVLFGSALKNEGVKELLDLIDDFSRDIDYPEEFGARVYKVSEDEQGNRLTHVKITGGLLKTKTRLSDEEKVDQIRLYNGTGYEMLPEAEAGMVVSLKGLNSYEPGAGMGFEPDHDKPLLNGFMNYELVLPPGANALVLADTCKELAAEDPQLNLSIDEKTKQIHVQIMGNMQMEVLQKKIQEKSGITVGFSTGRIVYEETVASEVEGAGHFEPLRHYAEVHVRLEPLKRGSGIQVVSEVSTDELSSSWQRSILSALTRKRHRGVLTGSPLTDVRIVLTAGKGNIKHTTGGDFRQAACRAVRQSLMKADSLLLEPYYSFELEIPSAFLSRSLYDLETKHAKVEVEEQSDGTMLVKGRGPVRTLMNYQNDVIAYTKGKGRFHAVMEGYDVSDSADEIIQEIGYDPEMDLYNSPDSVFCANGTGYTVPWNEADAHMHIQLKDHKEGNSYSSRDIRYKVNDQDLGYILQMTSGKNRNQEKEAARKRMEENARKEEEKKKKIIAEKHLPELLIVDGYNMIYAWDSLKDLAYEDLSLARDKLIDDLFNYLPYLEHPITVVFDGYKVKGNIGTTYHRKDLTVIYTKAGETADAWLERSSYELKGKYKVTYATSDGLIQNAVFSQGGLRMSARELESRLKQYGVIPERK